MQALAVLLCAFVAASFAEYKPSDDVVILTDATFDDILKDNQYVLAEFYAPWCGHCKTLEPECEPSICLPFFDVDKKAATALKSEGVVLGALDATAHQGVAGRAGVQGYPTLKFYNNGNAVEYTGGRTADTIVSWIRKRLGPAAKTLAASEIESFAQLSAVAVVGFFASNSDESFKIFETIASGLDEVPFGVSFDSAAAQAHGLASGEGLVLFKKFDEGKNLLEGAELSQQEMKTFIEVNRTPIVIPFTMEVAGKIFQSPIGVIAMLFTNSAMPEYSALAQKHRGKFVFSTADSSYDRLNSYIGITADQFPEFYILANGASLVKYPLEGDVTPATVEGHIDAYLSGSLKPYFKSDPVPTPNDEPVTIIVGKNFESIVLDSSKDVLLEIYAPWCGHCKTLAPVWEKLGVAFQNNDNVVIAKMDGTSNEVDGVSIKGFPTLQFYPAGAKSVSSAQAYSGGRDFDSLKKFLDENAKSTASTKETKDEL